MWKATRVGRRAARSRKSWNEVAEIYDLDGEAVRVLATVVLLGKGNIRQIVEEFDKENWSREQVEEWIGQLEEEKLVEKA